MKKYYFNDGVLPQGPYTIDELKEKNIKADTPVREESSADWTTGGQLEELKEFFLQAPPTQQTTVPDFKAVATPETVVTPATTTVSEKDTSTTASSPMPGTIKVKPAKKSTAWLSYVLGLLVLVGAGYLVYQDMGKSKGNEKKTTQMPIMMDSVSNSEMHQMVVDPEKETPQTETITTSEIITPAPEEATVTTNNTPPAANTTKSQKATLSTANAKPGTGTTKSLQNDGQKTAANKIEEERKKALAAAAKEMDYRNNWPVYISIGKLDYTAKGDGVEAFNVPVYNGTNALVDKVTVRIDYMKKEKKVLKSETIIIYNIPPGSGVNGKAPENKKGNNIKVTITGITSRALHFCYPGNSGNPADPNFCN
ncbi:MAG: DUF4339 domain-containing protein [Chitinophagaceae bacterium]